MNSPHKCPIFYLIKREVLKEGQRIRIGKVQLSWVVGRGVRHGVDLARRSDKPLPVHTTVLSCLSAHCLFCGSSESGKYTHSEGHLKSIKETLFSVRCLNRRITLYCIKLYSQCVLQKLIE